MSPASLPQGGGGTPQLTVQVVVTDTMGGLKIPTKIVDLFHPTSWPRSTLAEWKTGLPDVLPADASQGVTVFIDAECDLFNSGLFTDGAAEIRCTNLIYTAPDDSMATCPQMYFGWDGGSQSFRLTSNCFAGP